MLEEETKGNRIKKRPRELENCTLLHELPEKHEILDINQVVHHPCLVDEQRDPEHEDEVNEDENVVDELRVSVTKYPVECTKTRVHAEAAHACRKKVLEVTLAEQKGGEILLSDMDLVRSISVTNVNVKISPLERSNLPPERTLLVRPRKKLLVLDLNGLLADIVSPPPKDHKADITISRRAIFKRPFYAEFLDFCFEKFDVGIWSSRTKKNVGKMVHYLMGALEHKLLFCWDLSHCTRSGSNTLENKHKALVFKELRKIWEQCDPSLPWKKGDYTESNTLLLDDSPYKALLNPPNTSVFPYPYSFHNKIDNALGHGGDIRVYLEGVASAENVQMYVEQHPFGQSAIYEGSPSWDFYRMVITKMTSS